ncbi:Transcriptional regulator [Tenacibaculum litopenaei]|uniref:LysR family transcriptional regulator n=1 Tax=Tenacibaculum litopenaei TaxID=396016 RepID=UPI0038944BB2
MSYQIEYRHLKYFLAVAQELHYRKAAEKLFISQPGLSRQIKQLEEGLGFPLFERHNRKVALTAAGLYLQRELTQHLQGLDALFSHAKLISDGKDGKLSLGYVGSAMRKVIPELLVRLNQKYPNITFALKEMDNESQIAGLLGNEIDIGFVRLERAPRSLHMKTVLVEPFCLVVPKEHPILEEHFIDLRQLKDESFILFDPKYSVSYYEKVMQLFDAYNFSPLVSHNTIHAESIFKLVENGFGVSIVPQSLTNTSYQSIRYVSLDKIPQRTVLSAVWNKENRNPVISKAISLLSEVI